jgi:hypothetical protein
MTEDNFKIVVLGDLTEKEAQNFVFGDGDGVAGGWPGIINNVPPGTKAAPAGAREKWSEIYKRCGGNIGLLNQCVLQAKLVGNWDAALDEVVANPCRAVDRGFEPRRYIVKGGKAPLWTAQQWKMVLELITTATDHAVLVSEMKKELGDGDVERGSEILLSMGKYNLLALRPFSTLARDITQEVYEDDKEDVVTLPLPAHVWAAEATLEDLKAAEAKDSSDP